jgi:RNA polymerase sigma factor (sigma-70 family)
MACKRFEEFAAMTDRQLLQRFVAANDAEAFRALIDRHGPMVLSVCRSVLRAQHDAEDAFQSTFLVLARRAGTIKQAETIGAWLHRVAFRVAHKSRRKAIHDRSRERVFREVAPERSLAAPDLSSLRLVREEVSRLPARYRQPVVLCYLDGKTNQEAAAQLRCPIGTIKGRLWRARQRLRDRLSRRGLDPSSSSLRSTFRA